MIIEYLDRKEWRIAAAQRGLNVSTYRGGEVTVGIPALPHPDDKYEPELAHRANVGSGDPEDFDWELVGAGSWHPTESGEDMWHGVIAHTPEEYFAWLHGQDGEEEWINFNERQRS